MLSSLRSFLQDHQAVRNILGFSSFVKGFVKPGIMMEQETTSSARQTRTGLVLFSSDEARPCWVVLGHPPRAIWLERHAARCPVKVSSFVEGLSSLGLRRRIEPSV